MEHATLSILNAVLSKGIVYFIVTNKDGASGKKKDNERKLAASFLKPTFKHRHTNNIYQIFVIIISYSSIPNNWHTVGT